MSHFRMGKLASPFAHKPQRRANPSCNTGGFYISPTASQSIEYTTPVNITWDTTCLNSTNVDIFLYAPGTSTTRIHAWQGVYFPTGSYQTLFQPKWWNSTSPANLQLTIVPSGTPPFLAPYPAGPVFTVTYHAPSSGGTPAVADTSKADTVVTVVKNAPSSHQHISGGKLAAAVLMPLLIVIFLISAAYVKLRRDRGRDERKQWSESVDKRMSTISTNWKPISAAGAQAAIRNSMAIDSNNRGSSFSFGNIRPVSTVAVESGQAGIGSNVRTVLPGQSNGTAQLRSSAVTAQMMAERVSRVSFAPDVRPSTESRRTVTSRAFHTPIVPPLPDRKWDISQSSTPNSEPDEFLSPTQTKGPQTLSVEDIQARLAGRETSSRPSVDAVIPALRLMRTSDPSPGSPGEDEPELLFSAQSAVFPAIPSPTHSPHSAEPASAMSTFMPMQPMPANMMSPDDMLRAYAERRAAGGSGGPTVPSPAYTGAGAQGGMRTLYSPTHSLAGTNDRSTKRTTMGSQFADEDAYAGTL
ncbi:hypothetical protein B0F90DRAFT_1278129 [Multifurca ochricompacta]|uniref:Transmembrane protein n=1 Tax=Multifurca ochricompacta TaxID=376703 RepID=A0AAD4LYK6_9AGAM|nr:hypothetical protein B0F90DRAFT_1278129 [Multifurca ochricompacta]